MGMTRGEATALGVAAAGHVLLFGVLSVGFLATPNPDKLEPQPIEVTLADDVALTSASPEISSEAPAAKKSPVEAPLEPDTAPEPAPEPEPAPPEPQPAPAPAPQPKPAPPKPAPPKPAPAKPAPAKPAPAKPQPKPQPQPKPAPKAAPAKPSKPAPAAPTKPARAAPAKPTRAAPATPTRTAAAGKSTAAKPAAAAPAKARGPVKPSGRLEGLDLGASDRPSPSKSNAQPAATVGPQVRSALQAEVIRQIKPHWTPPSGADSEKLRTRVVVSLNKDGSVQGEPRVTQTGVTDSNRVQAALHRERAIRAVKLAAPFKLPAQYYDGWKTIAPTLYEGL